MRKRGLYSILTVVILMLLSACNQEGTLNGDWTYQGPVPEIANGPTEAHKLCYALYQKYDLHVYWDLAGSEALKLDFGNASATAISSNNAAAIPIQPAAEITAEKFLKLLTGFFALLPDEMVKANLYRRQILVKVNPGKNTYVNEKGERYFVNTHTGNQYGYLFYGYLANNTDLSGDKFDTELFGWKWNICYQFFRGFFSYGFKNFSAPETYGLVSKGYYAGEVPTAQRCLNGTTFNSALGGTQGFIHPFAAEASTFDRCEQDWSATLASLITMPQAELNVILATYPKIAQKAGLIKAFLMEHHDIDMEELAARWR